jgi:hypothetical protein
VKLVFPGDEATNVQIAEWVMQRLGRRAVKPYRSIGAVDEAGQLVAGVVFNGYNGANVDLSIYAPGCISRSAIRQVMHYAFDVLKATRITVRIKRRRRGIVGKVPLYGVGGVVERLGFVFECCAARYYGEGKAMDAMVYRMLREDCRWLDKGPTDGRTRGTGPQRNGGRANPDEQRHGHHAGRS